MSNDPSLASHTATNSLHVAATALAVLREARTTSADACLACQLTLPSDQRASARTDRVPVIVVGVPHAALECTVAMLATCSSAAALALGLSLAFDDAPRVAALTTAVEATSRSAGIAVRALHLHGSTDPRLQLAHATARATHQVADALSAPRIGHDLRVKVRRSEFLHNRFPPAWRNVIACLGERLASRGLDEPAAERAAAAAAHDAAGRVMHVYEEFPMAGAADGARRRYARIAALASIYAGWSALEINHAMMTVQSTMQA